jgi:hypothetical protein
VFWFLKYCGIVIFVLLWVYMFRGNGNFRITPNTSFGMFFLEKILGFLLTTFSTPKKNESKKKVWSYFHREFASPVHLPPHTSASLLTPITINSSHWIRKPSLLSLHLLLWTLAPHSRLQQPPFSLFVATSPPALPFALSIVPPLHAVAAHRVFENRRWLHASLVPPLQSTSPTHGPTQTI